jgi:glycosyltransferase involved in cell wall biosynthesis
MLGWEFPPFISGGLGTACYGLTKAMSQQQTDVVFVLPKSVGNEYSSHVKLLSPQIPRAAMGDRSPAAVASTYQLSGAASGGSDDKGQVFGGKAFEHVIFKAVPSRMISPYQSTGGQIHTTTVSGVSAEPLLKPISILGVSYEGGSATHGGPGLQPQAHYDGDLIAEAQRYARLCADLARGEQFDVIHAHDWLTFPAGLAVASATGKPLVVHVHSTEFDRAGENIHQQVYDIERRGMQGAIRVICVSHLTGTIVKHRYGINPDKVEVVYNGIENGTEAAATVSGRAPIRKGDKVVLFLGRITMQKGPEYFIRAARKVLEKYDKVKFVMAGSGDMAKNVIELAAAEGIGHKVLFTGFLRGKDVERVFKMADVYVMPSVSEPFGIAPLEAISHDVPVIISKTSGVAEVLQHALKVDFWDVEEMANKIIAVLRHPPLSTTLREHADMEVRQLTWDGAASKCREVYEKAIAAMPR